MSRRRSYHSRYAGNSARDYYSFGSSAVIAERRTAEKRDEASLRYYGKMKRIERRQALLRSVPNVIAALIVCACAIVIVFARSSVYNYQLENERLTATLEEEREKTDSIIAQNTEKADLTYIEAEASARLNMAKPQSYQIVYIEVPKTDYTVMHEASTVIEKEKTKLASYKDVVSGIKEAGAYIIGHSAEQGGSVR